MNDKVLVGTYHKTGTNLMVGIFSSFAAKTGKRFFNMSINNGLEDADILFSHDSSFDGYEYPAIHVIRDPRDMAISGERYHILGAEKTKEEWLADGYADTLQSLSEYSDRLIYEAEHATKYACLGIIKNMKKGFLTVKYEDLYLDIDNDFLWINKISEHFSLSQEESSLLK